MSEKRNRLTLENCDDRTREEAKEMGKEVSVAESGFFQSIKDNDPEDYNRLQALLDHEGIRCEEKTYAEIYYRNYCIAKVEEGKNGVTYAVPMHFLGMTSSYRRRETRKFPLAEFIELYPMIIKRADDYVSGVKDGRVKG